MNKDRLYEMQAEEFEFEEVRISYPNLESRETYKGDTKKYSVWLMIKKDNEDDMAELRRLIAHAVDIAVYANDGGDDFEFDVWQQCSLIDGDKEKDETGHGYMKFKASSEEYPSVYDAAGEKVDQVDAKDKRWMMKGGHYARGLVTAWYAGQSNRVVFDIGFLQHNKEIEGEEFGAPKADYSDKIKKGGKHRPSSKASANTAEKNDDGGTSSEGAEEKPSGAKKRDDVPF